MIVGHLHIKTICYIQGGSSMRNRGLITLVTRGALSCVRTPAIPVTMLAAALTMTHIHMRAQTSDQVSTLIPVGDEFLTEEDDFGGVKGLDLRSHGRQLASAIMQAVQSGQLVIAGGAGASSAQSHDNDRADDGAANVQVNDPNLDNIQTFTGTRPFEESTQSETSVAVDGRHVVVGYNSSA